MATANHRHRQDAEHERGHGDAAGAGGRTLGVVIEIVVVAAGPAAPASRAIVVVIFVALAAPLGAVARGFGDEWPQAIAALDLLAEVLGADLEFGIAGRAGQAHVGHDSPGGMRRTWIRRGAANI